MSSATRSTELRRSALRSFLGFLSLTAMLAMVTVLGGQGEFLIKVLVSSLTISAVSICAMCDAAYVEHDGNVRVGQAAAGLALLGGALLILMVWAEPHSEAAWKSTALLCVSAGFASHALLLRIPRLPAGQRWVTESSTVVIALLAGLINFLILFEYDGEPIGRLIATLGILSGLVTLAIPILVKLRGPLGDERDAPGAQLVLTHLDGDRYEATDGSRYTVRPLAPTSPPDSPPG